ncbi:hypothetical protein ScPMuIL_010977 [Solemya velum]
MWYFVLVAACVFSQILDVHGEFDDSGPTACGTNFLVDNNATQIISPNISANTSCSWHIQTNTTRVYSSFSLSVNQGDSVTFSSAKSGNVTANVTYSGNNFLVVSSGVWTNITFKTGKKPAQQGALNLMFDRTVCTRVLNPAEGVWEVSSPLYLPGTGDIKCSYSLTVDSAPMRVLTFQDMDISKGNLEVRTEKSLGNFTGSSNPDDFFIAVPTAPLTVTFDIVLSNSTKYQSFRAILLPTEPECSGVEQITKTETAYLIVPEQKQAFAGCRKVFKSPVNTTMVANISSVENIGGVDKILMNDGGSQSSSPIANLDTSVKAGTLAVTSGNTLWVRVLLDETQVNRKINISIRSQANGGQMYNNGNFSLSRAHTVNDTAYYQFMVNSASQVELKLNGSSLMSGNKSQIDVFDGTSEYASRLGSFKKTDSFYPVTSSGPHLLLVARNFNTKDSFNGSFTETIPGCDKTFTGVRGAYEVNLNRNNSQCGWTISPQSGGGTIVLQFQSVYLRVNDTLTIYKGASSSDPIAALNSSTIPSKIPQFYFPAQNGARIVLKRTNCSANASAVVTGNYWLDVEGCGGFMKKTKALGGIKSPNFPDTYPLNSRCVWDVIKH